MLYEVITGVRRLRLLAQDEFLDLSGRGLGQHAELHVLGDLVAGEVAAAVLDDGLDADLGPFLSYNFV